MILKGNVMKKSVLKCIFMLICIMLFSCSKQEKKPFGAADINYEDIEKLGKEGPTIESEHKENMAPFSDLKSTSEIGPESSEDPNISKAPMADKELYPDYGGIPIVTKETTRFVESESNESE